MTDRRTNPPTIKTRSLDPRVVAEHAADNVRDGRLMMQAVADVLVYSTEAALRNEGSSLEAADATIALARRFAEGAELDGDAIYGAELSETLTEQDAEDTRSHNELFRQGRRGPDPAIHYVTDAAYWALALLSYARTLASVERYRLVIGFEEFLKSARVLGWLVGEQEAPVRIFVASINSGPKVTEASGAASRRPRVAPRPKQRRA